MINLELAEQRGLSTETILQIERLHAFRDSLEGSIAFLLGANNRKLTYEVGQMLFKIEEELQKLWNFPVDRSYYKFWNVPTCSCGNQDRVYPQGNYNKLSTCWLHWSEKEAKEQAEILDKRNAGKPLKYVMIDPPSGWIYGFPKKMLVGDDIKTFLAESGYPSNDCDFAAKHCRMWPMEDVV